MGNRRHRGNSLHGGRASRALAGLLLAGVILLAGCNAQRRVLITLGSISADYSNVVTAPRVEEEQETQRDRPAEADPQGVAGQTVADGSPSDGSTEGSGPSAVPRSLFAIREHSLIDKENQDEWEPFHDNPSSMIRYLMVDQDTTLRMPEFAELIYFFDKVSYEMRADPEGGLAEQEWLLTDGYYISSTEIFTAENRKYYKGLYWDSERRSYVAENLAPGDLVYMILIVRR